MSILKNMFKTLKTQGLVKHIEQHLLLNYQDDANRRSDINSPSSALGCVRASYYSKKGYPKKSPLPRVLRIFGNGHGVHYRIQKYFKDMEILLMNEVPVFNIKYNIQGHSDSLILLDNKVYVVEIKSINTRGFTELRREKIAIKEHRAQATIYMFCLERHRIFLQEKYSSKEEMINDEEGCRKFYHKLYEHLKDDNFEGGKTREQKINKKVREHLKLDLILYDIKNPITEMIILYEDKNTQELEDFYVSWDEDLLKETLKCFIKSNTYFALDVVPPRECKYKNNQCNFSDICFK